MPGERDGGAIGRAFREHRPYLVDLAFRMLGDISRAPPAAAHHHGPAGRSVRS